MQTKICCKENLNGQSSSYEEKKTASQVNQNNILAELAVASLALDF